MDDTSTTNGGPTTVNGLLHDPATTLDDRRIVAFYDTAAEAAAARDRLVEAGIGAARIAVAEAGADAVTAANARAPDQGIVGKLREALLPDDDTTVHREAVARGQHVLTVVPQAADTDQVVTLLQATGPRHFDARLERWRNAG